MLFKIELVERVFYILNLALCVHVCACMSVYLPLIQHPGLLFCVPVRRMIRMHACILTLACIFRFYEGYKHVHMHPSIHTCLEMRTETGEGVS